MNLFDRPLSRLIHFLLLSILALAFSPVVASAEQPTVVYRWDADSWLSKFNHEQFSAVPVKNADGTTGAQITVTARDAANPYNHILASAANMKGGNQYTAIITFRVIEPTKYPTSFFMFARNSAGNQYDIWQTWIGLPGVTRSVCLPMNLKAIPNGTWKLYMGISKSGGIEIDSIVVYSGLTSDGRTTYVTSDPVQSHPTTSPVQTSEATGSIPFTIAPPAAPVATISMAQYKFVADSPGAPALIAETNAISLQQALDDCKAKGAAELVIPHGTYRISAIHNITIDSANDISIDGQGSTLIAERLTKEGPFISISHCSRMLIKNLSLDWDWNVEPIASLGTVSNLSADKTQCDFTFPDLNAVQTKLTQNTPWHAVFGMDPVHLIRNDTGGFSVPKHTQITSGSAENILHVTFPGPMPLVDGKSYCIRHMYYEMGGFKVANASDLSFKGVSIYSMPGMGWYFEGAMQRFELVNCPILRAPGSRTPFTTAADGFHVDEFVQDLNIDHCSVTGAGDDAMNVHNECYQGEIVLDPADNKKITLVNCPSYQLRLEKGDAVAFYNGDYSNLDGATQPVTREIAAVSSDNKGKPQTVIQFTQPIPASVTALSILGNARFKTSNASITNFNVEYSNGRGILLSAQNVLVKGCTLRNVYGTAMNLETDIVQPLWTEGRGDSNILIRDNTFENCNQQVRYGGAIINTDVHIPWGPTNTVLYHQISIERNQFIGCPGPAVSLTGCSDVVVNSNEVSVLPADLATSTQAGTLFIMKSSDLSLTNNIWKSEPPSQSVGGVIYDPATTENISIQQ